MGNQWLSYVTAGAGDYVWSGWLFLRLLGLTYAIAFVSLAVQIQGLVGSRGILPVREFLREQKELWGARRFWVLPTLCWWNDRDGFLQFLGWGGAVLSLLLIVGIAPVLVLALLWLFYLSLYGAAREFLSYQWDILLLETGFLAIFFAPFELTPHWPPVAPPPRLVLWLNYWLLFRLMFASGVIKWRSGDPVWRDLSALKYHYETQPLPTPLSWHMHRLPLRFHRASSAMMFGLELVFPFFIVGPLPLRYAAAAAFIALMLLIQLTGNYGFFNLITIALSLLLLDDSVYRPLFQRLPGAAPAAAGLPFTAGAHPGWPGWVLLAVALLIFILSAHHLARLFEWRSKWPAWWGKFAEWFDGWLIVNSYGLFAVMTTERFEIIVEGSPDGQTWRAYEFKWKPGDVKRPPGWVAPHQPRLDWQMWFAALSDVRFNRWFVAFLFRLLKGAPDVLALLRRNPFPNAPPAYVRAVLYQYHFTDRPTRRRTGAVWWRERKWLYAPVLSLRGREDKLMPPADFE